jgi:hypothetical protein
MQGNPKCYGAPGPQGKEGKGREGKGREGSTLLVFFFSLTEFPLSNSKIK